MNTMSTEETSLKLDFVATLWMKIRSEWKDEGVLQEHHATLEQSLFALLWRLVP